MTIDAVDSAPKARIVNAGFVAVCALSLAALTSFYLLLSTVPLYTAQLSTGDSAGIVAGLTTGALMLTTVLAELATPRLMDLIGPRPMFVVALVCLGVPPMALAASESVAGALIACLVRGFGFGIAVVVGGALVAELAPPGRRGETLGLYGVVVTVPAVAALPLGVWLAESVGFGPTFVAGGAAALLGVLAVPGIRARASNLGASDHHGMARALRDGTLLRPAVLFGMTALAAGVVITFLPLATGVAAHVAALALLTQALTATLARWWAGRVGDRRGSATLIVPGLLLTSLGTAGLLLRTEPAIVIAAMAVFGFGFGVAQNSTMTLMFERSHPSGYGAVSGLWNLAYDAGLGAGAVGFGFVVATTDFSPAFAVVAILVLAVVPVATADRRREPAARADP